jgi:Fic family protein
MTKAKPYIPKEFPPKGLKLEPFIREIVEANRGIALFDGVLQGLVNPDILLSPLTTNEAVLSSRIEGTQATFEDVLQEEAGITRKDVPESLREDAREVLNYRKALIYGAEEVKVRPLSLTLIKEIHRILLSGARGRNRLLGEFRNTQNWIGIPGTPIDKATFIPPDPIILPEHLDKWEEFLKSDSFPDRIVQLGLLHAQFEILHPFEDGNGRIGRLIIPLFLYWKGLLSRPSFYLSEYFEKTRSEYYERLLMVTQRGDWSGWIAFFLEAVIEQAKENIDKAQKLLALYDEMKNKFIQSTNSQYAIPALDAFFKQPIIDTSTFVKLTGIPRRSGKEILTKLAKEKLISLRRPARGNNPAVYELGKILEIGKR